MFLCFDLVDSYVGKPTTYCKFEIKIKIKIKKYK